MTLDRSAHTTSFVVFSGTTVDWAIRAETIREVVSEADWDGDVPFDVAALWGDAGPPDVTHARVLVVRTRAGLRGIRAGRITYRSVDMGRVCPLPDILARAPASAFVAGIVFEDAHPALVVLDPEGLSYDRAGQSARFIAHA
jgi:hypothetical protein